jgi:hypothetical protein
LANGLPRQRFDGFSVRGQNARDRATSVRSAHPMPMFSWLTTLSESRTTKVDAAEIVSRPKRKIKPFAKSADADALQRGKHLIEELDAMA